MRLMTKRKKQKRLENFIDKFKDGEIVERKMGALAKKQLKGMLEKFLD